MVANLVGEVDQIFGTMMITVGVAEAKTQLSTLLDRVAGGEEVLITRHGRAIARLVPEHSVDRERVAAAIARLKELAKDCRLDGLSIRTLRDQGRA
jgi:prevent-host-death family protein